MSRFVDHCLISEHTVFSDYELQEQFVVARARPWRGKRFNVVRDYVYVPF